jgi:hypothetical protein
MTHDKAESGKPILYWITLTIIFAAFVMVAIS